MKLIYPLNTKNDFVFNSSPRDFTVTEIPLYEFSGEGEHLILQVRKKDMTTWEMLDTISNHIGIRRRDIGYAGLKDKNAMTVQYISLLAKFEEKLENFTHDKIKIISKTKHNNKIRIGHLKGNHFKIRLKKVLGVQKDKLQSGLKWIKRNGVPNYFGNQRFGNGGDNWIDGKKILDKELKIRDKKKREFLISAYQSYLFNNWLSKRMEINHLIDKFNTKEIESILKLPINSLDNINKQEQFFKILKGDVMMHYPYGRVFLAEDIEEESKRFFLKDISISGLIAGKKVTTATDTARIIEENFDEEMDQNGTRRYAWIFLKDVESKYIEEKAHFELSFTLPKGSYATNVLDILRGENTQ